MCTDRYGVIPNLAAVSTAATIGGLQTLLTCFIFLLEKYFFCYPWNFFAFTLSNIIDGNNILFLLAGN